MGFMDGLAAGFQSSFQKMEETRNANKQDAFRAAYDSYTKKRAQYEADKKRDDMLIKQAKGLMRSIDPNAPYGAWEHAYDLLAADVSPENVIKQLSGATFSLSKNAAISEDTVVPGAGTWSNDMKKAGLNPLGMGDASQPQSQATQVTDNGGITGFLQNAFDPNMQQQRAIERADKSIMDITGSTPEDMQQLNTGYQGHESSGRTVMNAGGVSALGPAAGLWSGMKVNEAPVGLNEEGILVPVLQSPVDGNWYEPGAKVPTKISKVFTADIAKNRVDARNKLDDGTKDYRDKAAAGMSFIQNIQDIASFVNQNEGVLTRVSNVESFISEVRSELSTAKSIFDQLNTDGNLKAAEQSLEQLAMDATVKSGLDITTEEGQKAQLFNAKIVNMAFQLARTQQGNQLTEKDFARALDQLKPSNDKNTFLQNAVTVANTTVRELDNLASYIPPGAIATAKEYGVYDENLYGKFSNRLDQQSRDFIGGKSVFMNSPSGGQTQNPNSTQAPTITKPEQYISGVVTRDKYDIWVKMGLQGLPPFEEINGKQYRQTENGVEID